MSKYTIIGDIHGRTIWRDIVQKESDSDKIIFLGDYVSTHYPNDISEDQEIEELYEILDYKEQNKDKVVLLRGNHDVEGLDYHWAKCYPKVRPQVAQYMRTVDVSGWFLNNTQWVYRIPDTNIVCSHAGISNTWLENAMQYYKMIVDKNVPENIFDKINCINKIKSCELFGFTTDNPFDIYGDSWTQPCTWIRPMSLNEDKLPDIVQIVGHTRDYEKGCIYHYGKELWCIDALSNSKETPSEYLVIENGEFKVCKI